MIIHSAFFGDAAYTFALTDTVIDEFEKKAGVGIGVVYLRMTRSQFDLSDINETIRLGLIGGGTTPEVAHRLVTAYAKDRPLEETLPLALDILDARFTGKPDTQEFATVADLQDAAASGDLAAAIHGGAE